MQLTEAGQLLEQYAERLFSLEAAAERAMQDLANFEGGELQIGASNTVGTYLLPKVLARFHRDYPKVRVQVRIDNTERIVRGVHDAIFALGFVEGSVDDELLEAVRFDSDRIVAVIAPDHPLARIKRPSLKKIAAHPALLREVGSGTREIIERALAQHDLKLDSDFLIGSSEALKRTAMAGGGVGWLSELCVTDEIADGRLIKLSTPELDLRRPLFRLTLKGRHLSHSARALIRMFP
jgi:DNA-binding transcriptional LysR family regulator